MSKEQPVLIEVNNVYSHILHCDKQVNNALKLALRFRPPNYWHSLAYKNGHWDGWRYFYNPSNRTFFTGLLPEVCSIIKKLGYAHKIYDKREPIRWKYEQIGPDFLQQFNPDEKVTLRDFQVELVNKCIKYGRGIIQAPTGAGKTFIMTALLKCLDEDTNVLFITKNASLVDQNWKIMKKWGVPNLGRWYGRYKEKNGIMCITAHKKTFESLDSLLPHFQVLLVDEIHECASDVPVRAYKKMTNAYIRLGFSATPFRWQKSSVNKVQKYLIKGLFGPVFKVDAAGEEKLLTAKVLQKRGILSKSRCIFYPINEPDLKHETYQDAVLYGIEKNIHLHEVIRKLALTLKGRTLIIVERIDQGEQLHNMIPNSYWIHGKDSLKKRSPVIEQLNNSKNCIAIVIRHIITSGIDIKIHNLINACAIESKHNIIQQIGRGLRVADDKDVLNYIGFIYNINKYLYEHSKSIIRALKKEGHEIIIKDSLDFMQE